MVLGERVGYIIRGEAEGIVAEAFDELKPGKSVWGMSYDEIVAHGSGVLELGEDRKPRWVETE